MSHITFLFSWGGDPDVFHRLVLHNTDAPDAYDRLVASAHLAIVRDGDWKQLVTGAELSAAVASAAGAARVVKLGLLDGGE
jgi:hypothetical protein